MQHIFEKKINKNPPERNIYYKCDLFITFISLITLISIVLTNSQILIFPSLLVTTFLVLTGLYSEFKYKKLVSEYSKIATTDFETKTKTKNYLYFTFYKKKN